MNPLKDNLIQKLKTNSINNHIANNTITSIVKCNVKRKFNFSNYQDIFKMFNQDGSGEVGSDELELVLDAFNIHHDKDDLDKLINEIDDDGSGKIDIIEFM